MFFQDKWKFQLTRVNKVWLCSNIQALAHEFIVIIPISWMRGPREAETLPQSHMLIYW